MFDEDEMPPAKSGQDAITVGDDLSDFSLDELTMRIAALAAEIERVELAIIQKNTQANEAEDLFN